mgnify:CR=1 FL=1
MHKIQVIIKDLCGGGFQPRSFNLAAGSRSHNPYSLFLLDNRKKFFDH